mmetsp:Transcript_45890/g.121308  ORF Transcript_45890/g.121308 Transcript_45890/m.121308 type:complete len:208 (+) Transcript_45890:274-897(+)
MRLVIRQSQILSLDLPALPCHLHGEPPTHQRRLHPPDLRCGLRRIVPEPPRRGLHRGERPRRRQARSGPAGHGEHPHALGHRGGAGDHLQRLGLVGQGCGTQVPVVGTGAGTSAALIRSASSRGQPAPQSGPRGRGEHRPLQRPSPASPLVAAGGLGRLRGVGQQVAGWGRQVFLVEGRGAESAARQLVALARSPIQSQTRPVSVIR